MSLDTKSKLIQFLQSSSGDNSSKRLIFVSGAFFSFYLTDSVIDKLIAAQSYESAVTLAAYFLIFIAVIGGFVAAELIVKVIEILKGTNKITNENDKPSPDIT